MINHWMPIYNFLCCAFSGYQANVEYEGEAIKVYKPQKKQEVPKYTPQASSYNPTRKAAPPKFARKYRPRSVC